MTSNAKWTVADLHCLDGRTFVITRANTGLGLTAARAFGAAGAHVVLAVRDVERGRSAADTISGSIDVRRLDLADLSSVREFAAGWDGELDVLVNNAAPHWRSATS